MLTVIVKGAFTGKRYIATVRIGTVDVDVSHLPVIGETRADIDKALIAAAKEEIFLAGLKSMGNKP